jgi:pilus assembly protein CpaB
LSTATAAGSNQERTNRWLLIGAIALAVVAGLLIFVALANVGGSDEASRGQVSPGDTMVLVAADSIPPNTRLTDDMFEVVGVAESALVPNAALDTERSAAIGKVTTAEILRGEQISFNRLAAGPDGSLDQTLATKLLPGERGMSVGVDRVSSVSGFVVPGDRVDLVVTFSEGSTEGSITRVQTLLQDVRVIGFDTETLDPRPSLDHEGNPTEGGSRRSDLDPNPAAGTATLALTPQQVQILAAAVDKGTITLVLRPLGERGSVPVDQTFLGDAGFLPPTSP